MAVYLARDDMAGRVSGGKAVMLMEDVLRLTKIDIMVDATKYQSDYDANEIAADKRYRGRKILLVGTIRSIEKDFMERGYLTLGADSLLGVRAQLSDRGMAGAESLRAGSRIYLVCDSGERIIGTATADNCQRFSQYSQEIGPSLTEVFTDFLSGRKALPKRLATAVTYGYVLGSSLPASSPCFADDDEACSSSVVAIGNDKARSQALQQETQRMMASLKIN